MPRALLVFEPPDGGVAENVLRLAEGLPARGFDVTLAGPPEALPYAELDGSVPIHRLPFRRGYGDPLADARALRSLIGLMRSKRFDIAHVHSAKAGVLGRLAARATGTPAVYSPHCFPFVGPWGPARKVFSTTVERALGSVSAAIVCVAEQERGVALDRKVARAERLSVVHNGAPSCEHATERDAALDEFARGGALAATISVLRPQKGIHHFIDAAPRVLAAVPDARFAVIGNEVAGLEGMRDELIARAGAHGLGDRLRFFPFLGPTARQLASLDLFVLPSDWEAFPISILEAMACGVPAVATAVGGTAEAVVSGETGILCPPGDVGALAEAVASLLGNEARRRAMGAAAQARHAAEFTLDQMVDGTAAVYRRVLA
ncbi:MAG: hypothetical protein QOI11_2158 [Candidatus Eremiobacteraeota bacterium]|jgi:glycosyltransferase involved in cell wall biosynthesis|nr:hypothetical protein [Candidatus Eremiobacteraeota bacterium]